MLSLLQCLRLLVEQSINFSIKQLILLFQHVNLLLELFSLSRADPPLPSFLEKCHCRGKYFLFRYKHRASSRQLYLGMVSFLELSLGFAQLLSSLFKKHLVFLNMSEGSLLSCFELLLLLKRLGDKQPSGQHQACATK